MKDAIEKIKELTGVDLKAVAEKMIKNNQSECNQCHSNCNDCGWDR